jgi:hypothetical protein
VSPKAPTPQTLAKYGLLLEEWLDMAGEACRVCEVPWDSTRRAVVDHEHVKGWKTLPQGERRRYVRGVVCIPCNHFVLTRYGSPLKHRNAAVYLDDYEARKGASL